MLRIRKADCAFVGNLKKVECQELFVVTYLFSLLSDDVHLLVDDSLIIIERIFLRSYDLLQILLYL